ncbi:hypothetical protein ACFLZK_01145 [Patescibacteria group bacterium]
MKVNVFEILKSSNKEDFSMIRGPIIMLFIFFFVGFFLFPKPSNIYKEGVLKTCTCVGLKATPRTTKGSKLGDTYCIGIPIKCVEERILKHEYVKQL